MVMSERFKKILRKMRWMMVTMGLAYDFSAE
jgi:hypothetical protein